MARDTKLSIIMPAYNEIDTIAEIIKRVMAVKIPKELIIIDDGSKDGTRDFLSKIKHPSIKVVFHKKNQGKGAAIRTGLAKATGDIIIIQDSDLEYDPEDYHKLIKPILAGKSKVVYGTRFPRSKNRPPLSNKFFLANRILTHTTNILFGADITDEPTCYKVFSSEVFKRVKLKCQRFEFCPEVTAKVLRKGYKILEVPIAYHPRSVEEGKKINWKDAFEGFWTLVKYRFVS